MAHRYVLLPSGIHGLPGNLEKIAHRIENALPIFLQLVEAQE